MKKRIVWTYQFSNILLIMIIVVSRLRSADRINFHLCGKKLRNILFRLNKNQLFSKNINRFEFKLNEKYNSQRQNLQSIYESNMIDIHRKICDELWKNNDLSKYWYREESIPKVREYLEEQIANEIENTLKLTTYIFWHMEQKSRLDGYKCPEHIIIIPKAHWGRELKPHLEKLGLNVYIVRTLTVQNLLKYSNHLVSLIKNFLLNIKQNGKYYFRIIRNQSSRKKIQKIKSHRISVLYTRSIDLNERNDLYWLEGSGVDPNNVLIWCPKSSFAYLKKELSQIHLKGFNFIIDPLDSRKFKLRHRSIIKLITLFPKAFFSRKGIWQWKHLFFLMIKVDSFESIFVKERVKIDIRKNVGSCMVPQIIALDNVGGISVYVQWSMWFRPHPQLPKSNHVIFCWGPAYFNSDKMGSIFKGEIIYSGYLFDSYFKKQHASEQIIRETLIKNGAEFIICIFDEGESNAQMINYYQTFFNECLLDSTIGLVIKPKRNVTFFEHGELQPLLSKVKATGRCYIFESKDKEDLVTHTKNNPIFPHVAASISDVAISLISTAGIESTLIGVPTLYYDTVGTNLGTLGGRNPTFFSSMSESVIVGYDYGVGRFVFQSLGEMVEKIREHRKTPGGIPHFGDHTKFIDEIDPFRDGQASRRIGKYIGNLLNEMNNGNTRSKAIKFANKRYMKEWGKEKVL